MSYEKYKKWYKRYKDAGYNRMRIWVTPEEEITLRQVLKELRSEENENMEAK